MTTNRALFEQDVTILSDELLRILAATIGTEITYIRIALEYDEPPIFVYRRLQEQSFGVRYLANPVIERSP
jgi:hypothetical protein